IGASIADGDIAASTALGAAIGVRAGIVLAALYYSNVDATERAERQLKEQLQENQQRIFEQDRELEKLRSEVESDAPTNLDDSRRQHIFDGATRGNYYR